jgi:hypothetical protein
MKRLCATVAVEITVTAWFPVAFTGCFVSSSPAIPPGPVPLYGEDAGADSTLDSSSPFDGFAMASETGGDAAPVDAAVVIIPCTVGNAFLICSQPGGGACLCTSDLPTCPPVCDEAGCFDYCSDACVNQCASGQIAMSCGGIPRPPPPPWDDAASRITYVFADPPDVCTVAPRGGGPEGVYVCCPPGSIDR